MKANGRFHQFNQMTKPLFEERADRTLDKVRAVYAQRGGEYADTWRTCRFLAMKATAKKLGLVIPDEYCRALAAAAFYDMKYERLSGGYKDDSVIDAIAYGSFWIDEMVDLDKNPKVSELKSMQENLFAGFKPRIKPEPEQQYRILATGEIIEPGDEYSPDGFTWRPTASKGAQVGGSGSYSTATYRRPINPQENAVK